MFDNVSQLPGLGKTWYGPNGTIDTNNYGQSLALEGSEACYDDLDPSDRKIRRSNSQKRCKLVRNVSGITLEAKRIVTYASGFIGKRVDGYGTTTAQFAAGVVDEHIGSEGVRNGDLFWITTGGNTLVKTDLAGGANNLIPSGTVLVALTAATSQATTAGRVAPQSLAGATALLGDQLQNSIGRAMSAKTTSNTNADILVNLHIYR